MLPQLREELALAAGPLQQGLDGTSGSIGGLGNWLMEILVFRSHQVLITSLPNSRSANHSIADAHISAPSAHHQTTSPVAARPPAIR